MNVILENSTARNIGTSPVTVYTVPAATTSHIVSCRVCNTTSGELPISVYVSNNAGNTFLAKNLLVPKGESVNVLKDGKIILLETESIICVAGDANSFDCIISIMETDQ
jgi:hypothetical protein